MKPFYLKLSAIIIICCLGLIAYSNSFSGTFHFDDSRTIVNNPAIRNIRNLGEIWHFWPTRFITILSIAFNYHWGGLKVLGFHVFNFAVHLGASLLVFWLAILTLNTPLMKKESINALTLPIAFFSSAFFLLHPVQTQAVNYITQRATLLAAFFYIASLIFYIKSRLKQKGAPGSWPGKIYYIISLFAALLSMFSKEAAISLPFAICLYELCFLKGQKKLDWKYIIPFVVIALFMPLTMMLTKSVDFQGMHRMGEDAPQISAGHYFLTQLRVMVTYLRLALLPINQNLDYDYPISNSLFQIPVILSLLLLVSILVLAFKLLNKYKLISFAVFWFFITLLPESSVIPIMDVIFEHRLYLPMAGYAILLASAIYYLFGRKNSAAAVIILALLISSYSVLTYRRNLAWKDELALWSDTIRKSPLCARPYVSRALAYQNKGDFYQAILDYNKAIEIEPNCTDAYNDRGVIYAKRGDFNQAILNFSKVIEIKPNLAEAYNNRGNVYQSKGELDRALSDYNKAIELRPNYAEAYANRGIVHQIKGDLNNLALADYNKAIEIDPNYVEAYYNRAVVYFQKQEYAKSWEDVQRAAILGYKVVPEFIEALKKASGKKE